MKMKRLIACILMAFCLCSQSGIIVNADDNINEGIIDSVYEVRSTYLIDYTSELTISGTTATCKSTARGTSSVTQIAGDMYLEKYTSSGWEAIDAWRLQVSGNSYSNTKTSSGLSSGSYRLRTEFEAKTSSGATETVTKYSSIKYVTTATSG